MSAVLQLKNDFENASWVVSGMDAEQRILWADRNFPGRLALTSSFGVQSAVLLQIVHDLKLKIPVLSVDIAGPEHDEQRRYRSHLKKHFNFDLVVARALNEDDKLNALKRGLQSLGIEATLSGIRWSQMKEREGRNFVERTKAGPVGVNPILDWSDADTNSFLIDHPETLHPSYAPGAQSTGGRVLQPGEVKINCVIQ